MPAVHPKPTTFENLVKNDEIHFIKIKRCRMIVIETTNDPSGIKRNDYKQLGNPMVFNNELNPYHEVAHNCPAVSHCA